MVHGGYIWVMGCLMMFCGFGGYMVYRLFYSVPVGSGELEGLYTAIINIR